jgi:alpha-tubulin suppressor-like RCC1 family protein
MGASVYQRDRPAKIPGLTGVTQISAGAETAFALKSDGTVWAWGAGTWGALGNGSESGAAAMVPKKIAGLTGITQIAAGSNYDGYALGAAGRVWAWGGNYNGEIGNGTTTDALTPVPVKDLPAVTSISAGEAVAHAVTAAGAIYGWGYHGSVGTGQAADAKLPVAVAGYPGMTAVEGATAVFGIMTDGSLMAWGPPFAPPDNVVEPVNPYVVNGVSDVVAAASGAAGYAVRGDGTVWTWGSNYSSGLGQGATCASRVPVTVRGLSAVTSLAAGGGKAVVARTDGTVWTWGWNWPLDVDGAYSSMTPVQVTGLTGVTAVAAGGSTDYALRSNGTVWAWGGGASGQLGDGSATTDATTPQQVKGLTNIVQIAAGGAAGYALRADGTVWAWGYGYNGQLGNGRRYTSGCYCSAIPAQVRGITTAVQVAGGGLAGYALLNNGTIRAWGNNSDGVLGNRSTTSTDTPVTVAGIGTATAVSAGMAAGYAVLANGSGRAWGENFADELGIGQNGQTWNSCLCYDSPLKIAGLSGGVSVAGDIDYITDPGPSGAGAGGVSAYAVSADGSGWSWGCDDTGQLGSDSYLALGPKAGRLAGLNGVVQVASSEAAGFALVTS